MEPPQLVGGLIARGLEVREHRHRCPLQRAHEFRPSSEGEARLGPGRGARADVLYRTQMLRLRLTSRHLALSAAK
ncbi:MAG: hypothetical protein ICV73_19775 [Acetobacteraceae bacterium]|nr:hypothetical protein [Acetobacteraceae bacterium]